MNYKNYFLVLSATAVALSIASSYILFLKTYPKPSNTSTPNRQEPAPNRLLLPNDFKVYFREDFGVVNVPYPSLEERMLLTVNDFMGTPGCYVAAYSHQAENSAYSVSENIYVMGQVRVPGRYQGRICQPQGYEDIDISVQPEFGELFAEKLPLACQTGCWAGGDTGGWFGLSVNSKQ